MWETKDKAIELYDEPEAILTPHPQLQQTVPSKMQQEQPHTSHIMAYPNLQQQGFHPAESISEKPYSEKTFGDKALPEEQHQQFLPLNMVPEEDLCLLSKQDFETETMGITFERYFREQEGSQMPPIFKKYYSLAFKYIVFGIYMLLSLVVGTVLMIAFGIITAVTSFVITWILRPLLKNSKMYLIVYEDYFSAVLRAVLSPVFKSMGYCFSNINVRYHTKEKAEIISV